jgi:DNA invertase Pin-like site-specific DNA recombinase
VLKFGYARVSTQDQSLSLQLDALNHYEVDQIFEEKESGKRKNRPQLDELLKVLRKGDTVVIYKLVYHFWESYRRI